jgi:phosphatidylserine decarboxylase
MHILSAPDYCFKNSLLARLENLEAPFVMYSKMKQFMKFGVIYAIVACLVPVSSVRAQTPVVGFHHTPDTELLITMVEHDANLKNLLTESIEVCAKINPDLASNPVRSLEDYYNFIDWATTAMPFNILPCAANHPKLYESIDQSLCYFYYLIDQPLKSLEGKGYYHNSVEYVEPYRSWMILFTKHWGEFMSTPCSWNDEYYKMAYEDKRFGLQNGWYESPSNWKTYNDFFARRLVSPSVRPIDAPEDDAVVTAPADAVPQGIWEIDVDSNLVTGVPIKSTRFDSVSDLIGPDSAYCKAFANGRMTDTYLDVNDYHRFHFPVGGKILEIRMIYADDAMGGILIWNPEHVKYEMAPVGPGWQMIETRACIIVDTGKYGLVAVMPIAMSQVSSVNFEPKLKVGDVVKKGDQFGYFLFGGSDVVMIFQRQAGFELTAPRNGNSFVHLLMGSRYGEFRGK